MGLLGLLGLLAQQAHQQQGREVQTGHDGDDQFDAGEVEAGGRVLAAAAGQGRARQWTRTPF